MAGWYSQEFLILRETNSYQNQLDYIVHVKMTFMFKHFQDEEIDMTEMTNRNLELDVRLLLGKLLRQLKEWCPEMNADRLTGNVSEFDGEYGCMEPIQMSW